jgi:hypothetical protein
MFQRIGVWPCANIPDGIALVFGVQAARQEESN